MPKEIYSLKEVIKQRFDEMNEHLVVIREQVTKTNGRVGSLEQSRAQLWGAVAVLVVLGGAIIGLATMAIDSKIQQGVAEALRDNVEKVEYAK